MSDRVTVLRNGTLVGTYQTAALPRMELITLMLGRSLTELDEIIRHKIESSRHIGADALLEADGLGLVGSMEPFDLVLHAGRSSAWRACSAPAGPRWRSCCSASTGRPTAR